MVKRGICNQRPVERRNSQTLTAKAPRLLHAVLQNHENRLALGEKKKSMWKRGQKTSENKLQIHKRKRTTSGQTA
jgi:hypothetical protein